MTDEFDLFGRMMIGIFFTGVLPVSRKLQTFVLAALSLSYRTPMVRMSIYLRYSLKTCNFDFFRTGGCRICGRDKETSTDTAWVARG